MYWLFVIGYDRKGGMMKLQILLPCIALFLASVVLTVALSG
jgi:hypothetical protein